MMLPVIFIHPHQDTLDNSDVRLDFSLFEINEYVNCGKGLKQGCHKNPKTKFPDFSLSFCKTLTIFSLTFTMVL